MAVLFRKSAMWRSSGCAKAESGDIFAPEEFEAHRHADVDGVGRSAVHRAQQPDTLGHIGEHYRMGRHEARQRRMVMHGEAVDLALTAERHGLPIERTAFGAGRRGWITQ